MARFAGNVGVWMVAAIALVVGLALLDSVRAASVDLDEYGQEQRTNAHAIASAMAMAISDAHLSPTAPPLPWLADRLARLEDSESVRLLWSTDPEHIVDSRGYAVLLPDLSAALERGDGSLRLARPQSATVGLPARMSIAGIAPVPESTAKLVYVASAGRLRDRQYRARWRLLLTAGMGTALVLLFGRIAHARQRKELLLAGDERLVRADKLATLGALATGIAHEVSTPLAVIMGRAEQLVPKLEHDAKGQKAAHVILEQAERIRLVMEGLLGLARGQAPRLVRVETSVLAEKAKELVAHRFDHRRVALTLSVPDPAPVIACDPRLFEQALVNLLLNACDASPPGSRVSLEILASGESVRFVVRDEGHGISDEAMVRATEPFFTTKAQGEGTGLGLAIVNEITKHHRGTLALARRREKGTEVVLEVPPFKEQDHGS